MDPLCVPISELTQVFRLPEVNQSCMSIEVSTAMFRGEKVYLKQIFARHTLHDSEYYFYNELHTLLKYQHRNINPVLACVGAPPTLVFPAYMDWAAQEPATVCSWDKKVRLLSEIADGVAFLHENQHDNQTKRDALQRVLEYVLLIETKDTVHRGVPIRPLLEMITDYTFEPISIVHRGLNPSKIGWNAEKQSLVLLDFSHAVPLPKHQLTTCTAASNGDQSYLSPEQLSSWPLSPAVDVYAFAGIIFWVSCNGDPWSFNVRGWSEHSKSVRNGERPRIPIQHLPLEIDTGKDEETPTEMLQRMPLALYTLMQDCYKHKPEDRPRMTDVLARLRAMLHHHHHQPLSNYSSCEEKS